MKNKYLIILLTFISFFFSDLVIAQCDGISVDNITNPGPFEVATLTEANGVRNGPNYAGATIYYPTNATPPFASVAIVPGFVSQPSSVEEWGPFYASHGIVTIIIGTNSLFDFPEARANGLLDALETIKQENVRAASPLFGALNLEQLAVSGWSMGGGGAQRAAVLDNTISGVVALCPYLNSPQLNHQSPLLIFSGENDPTAPPAQHANIHYNVTPNTTNKVLFEVENGNHSVANIPTGADGAVGKIALAWLKLYVEKNDCYCSLLTDRLLVNPPAASNLLQDFECERLNVSANQMAIGFYPNPTKDIVNFKTSQNVKYKLFSPVGQFLSEGEMTGDQKQLDLSTFSTGIYYLNIEGQIIKLIKQN